MCFYNGHGRKLSMVLIVLLFLQAHIILYNNLIRRVWVSRIKHGEWSQELQLNNEKFYAALRLVEAAAYQVNVSNLDHVTRVDRYVVPNIIHYVRYKHPSFKFVDYICLRSAYVNQKPEYIFIHTDSTDGLKGKYWSWIKREPDLYARIVILPSRAPTEVFGHKLSEAFSLYHGADVARLQVMQKYGGIYLDSDMFVIRSLDRYRKYEMTVSWPTNGTIANMIIIANRNARFLARWIDNYRDYRPDLWYYNAGDRPAEILRNESHLAYREEKRLVTQFVIHELYQEKLLESNIVKYDAVHLLVRHRNYLDMFFKDYRYFNERNILHYPFAFGDMARDVMSSIPFLSSLVSKRSYV